MDNVTCSLTDDDLLEIKDNFKIDASLKILVPTAEQTIKMAPEGFVGIYHQFLKAGLRFPVFGFLKTILSHYNLHVAQLAPNSFRKIICFVMLSRALGVPPSLTLFRHFYVTLNTRDWVSFTRRQGIDDICDRLPSSIKKWKPEFLFVDVKEFSPNMVFGEHKNKAVDHPPELTPAQQLLIDQMVVNPVKWSDPDELMLGMAGLSTYWAGRGKQPIFMVGGKTVTLLDRLQRRKFIGATEVLEGPISEFLGPSVLDTALEEESSMDSANQTESTGEHTSACVKTVRRSQKGDRGARRPPSHPGRTNKDAYVLNKRGSASNAGGSASPESEKSGSAPEERTFASLYDCPVSSDASMTGVPVTSDVSPTKVIVFPASGLPSTASLIRSVDLPFPPSEKLVTPPLTVAIQPLVRKPTAVKAADSAFVKTLRGAGLGFGKFASAVVSSPKPLVSSEKHVDVMPESVVPSESCEAILDIPSAASSLGAVVSESVPDRPFPSKGMSIGGRAPRPTLMSLVAAAPAFRHPYMTSVVGRVPSLGGLSEEEGLDQARSLFIKGMHLANGIMLRQRTRASKLAAQQIEYDRLSAAIEKTRLTHTSLMEEKMNLVRDLQHMELRNQELTMELDGMKEKQKESLEVRQAVEKQLEDAQLHREADLKRLEEMGHQFDSLKVLFSEKVSGLDILCNQKEVVLKWQEAELQDQKTRLLILEDRVKTLTTECSATKQESLFYQQMSDQHVGDLAWLMKLGVVASVRAILHSEEFGNLNAACQAASIQVGLTQACLEMKAKYPMLEDEPLLHSYPRSQEELVDQFSEMTGHEYQLLKILNTGTFGVESLKNILMIGMGSAQLNVDEKDGDGVIGEREDDGEKCVEDEDKAADELVQGEADVGETGESLGDGADKGQPEAPGSDALTE
ncbi:hypothetical protein LXL04_001162 [Taraxacum kok-saghyz]